MLCYKAPYTRVSARNSRISAIHRTGFRFHYFLMASQTWCRFAIKGQHLKSQQKPQRQMHLALRQNLVHDFRWSVFGAKVNPFKLNGATPKT